MIVRRSLMIVLLLLSTTFSVVAEEDDAAGEPASVTSTEKVTVDGEIDRAVVDQIRQLISGLESARYVDREAATLDLQEFGDVAFPQLREAVESGSPEAATRSLHLLQSFDSSADLDLQLAALETLASLQSRPTIASEAASKAAIVRHELALVEIVRLQGQYLSARSRDPMFDTALPARIRIGEDWQGGDEGLALVAQVLNTTLVQIVDAPVTADGIRQLGAMRHLQDLQLIGTAIRIDDEQLQRLQVDMPRVRIDRRRGALLGVIGDKDESVAQVKDVKRGEAADKAGIERGDIIRKFNGEQVNSFQQLIDKIGKCLPGDKATLEIVRGRETLEVEVTFGRLKK